MTETSPSITILPGVPGMEGMIVDEDCTPYPESTTDFVKCARQRGIDVQFTQPREDRRDVGFKALEIWLPILEVTKDVLISVGAGLLVVLVEDYIGDGDVEVKRDPTLRDAPEPTPPINSGPTASQRLLHIDLRVKDGDHESRFRADGDAKSVLEALAQFEESIRDQ